MICWLNLTSYYGGRRTMVNMNLVTHMTASNPEDPKYGTTLHFGFVKADGNVDYLIVRETLDNITSRVEKINYVP